MDQSLQMLHRTPHLHTCNRTGTMKFNVFYSIMINFLHTHTHAYCFLKSCEKFHTSSSKVPKMWNESGHVFTRLLLTPRFQISFAPFQHTALHVQQDSLRLKSRTHQLGKRRQKLTLIPPHLEKTGVLSVFIISSFRPTVCEIKFLTLSPSTGSVCFRRPRPPHRPGWREEFPLEHLSTFQAVCTSSTYLQLFTFLYPL